MFRSLATALALLAAPALADPASVEAVTLRDDGGTWTASVTIRHADTGWDDYADGWRVETVSGDVLGTRVLAHPHVEEQPFTRTLGGLVLPPGTTEVMVRARTNVTGWDAEAHGPVPLPGIE